MVRSGPAPGYPWPEVTVYRRARASPEEVMALYADFEGQTRYLPGLVASRIVTRVGPAALHVAYEYEVTGPNERYTVAMHLARLGPDFEARWEMLTARYARRLSGHLRVRPHADGALIEYTSRVDPGTLGAALGSPQSVARSLQDTVQALAAEIERRRATEPGELAHLVRALAAMLPP